MGPKRHDGAMLSTSGTNRRKGRAHYHSAALLLWKQSCNGCKLDSYAFQCCSPATILLTVCWLPSLGYLCEAYLGWCARLIPSTHCVLSSDEQKRDGAEVKISLLEGKLLSNAK